MNIAAFWLYPSYPSNYAHTVAESYGIYSANKENERIQYKTREKDWRQEISVLNQEPEFLSCTAFLAWIRTRSLVKVQLAFGFGRWARPSRGKAIRRNHHGWKWFESTFFRQVFRCDSVVESNCSSQPLRASHHRDGNRGT